MASILDIEHIFEKVTAKKLKDLGFRKTPWGAPKQITYNEQTKSRGGRPLTRTRRKLHWDPCQFCWQWFDENHEFDDYYNALIYYFPEGFDGYVTPFQGARSWNTENPKHPAGYAYITIDNANDDWFEIMKIDYIEDLDVAKAIVKKQIKKRRKEIFGE